MRWTFLQIFSRSKAFMLNEGRKNYNINIFRRKPARSFVLPTLSVVTTLGNDYNELDNVITKYINCIRYDGTAGLLGNMCVLLSSCSERDSSCSSCHSAPVPCSQHIETKGSRLKVDSLRFILLSNLTSNLQWTVDT